MLTEAIVKNSLISSGKVYQSVGQVFLDGHNTISGRENIDINGKLYGSFIKSGSNYILKLYKDITKTEKVASATTTTLPSVVDFTEENDSGLSGYCVLLQYGEDDVAIVIQALLSVDADIPLGNLTTVAEYDLLTGFAEYHQKAMQYMTKEFIKSRIAGLIYNPDYQYLPDGVKDISRLLTKGYDYGKLLNPDTLKEASAWWALSRILEKHAIEPDGSFQVKAQEARNRVAAILHAVDLSIDERSSGEETRRRSLNVWKVSR